MDSQFISDPQQHTCCGKSFKEFTENYLPDNLDVVLNLFFK